VFEAHVNLFPDSSPSRLRRWFCNVASDFLRAQDRPATRLWCCCTSATWDPDASDRDPTHRA